MQFTDGVLERVRKRLPSVTSAIRGIGDLILICNYLHKINCGAPRVTDASQRVAVGLMVDSEKSQDAAIGQHPACLAMVSNRLGY